MKLIDEIKNLLPEMKQWRQHIHAHPEIAFEEFKTATFIKQKLKEFDIPFEEGLGTTGIVGRIEGKQKSSKSIGLRADIDALPIHEMNTFQHSSTHEGKMHACGHDGHTVMLLGAAKYLNKTKNFKGTVYLIFQPAEEGKAGAKKMIQDGLFSRFAMQEVYALHNWPGLKKGSFKIKPGPMMATSMRFELKIIGKGGHAAMPHTTHDPIVMAAQVILGLQTIVSRNINPMESAVVSTTILKAGDTINVIPEEAFVAGNVRIFDLKIRDLIEKRIKEITEAIVLSMGGKVETNFIYGYPVTFNSEKETEAAIKAATKVVGQKNIDSSAIPASMCSEDFSYMLQEKPGCYALIGNDDTETKKPCFLHSPHYDFNDEISPIGASYFAVLTEQQLPLET